MYRSELQQLEDRKQNRNLYGGVRVKNTFVNVGTRALHRCCGALLAMVIPIAHAQNTPDAVSITVKWVDTRPWEGVINPFFFVAFHDGGFDLYDLGRPLPEFISSWIPRALVPSAAIEADFMDRYPMFVPGTFHNPSRPTGMAGPPPPPGTRTVTLDPQRHRFMSYLTTIHPTNDAFVGNEDPYNIELFDPDGRFKGPMYIDIFGNQILDAGLCTNDERQLMGLHVPNPDQQKCDPGEGSVSLHPGLNGSARNPDGQPQNVLGGRTEYYAPTDELNINYDEIDADFSRPGYKLGRLIITRQTATGRWSGSWYSPERAGEGFNVEIVEPDAGNPRPRILVYWYTFEPDGSGEQVWLSGIGEFDADGGFAADVPLHRTVGGQFASPLNPGLVEREPWGRVRIGFGNCNDGRVFYYPDDPAWPAGDYFIHRLSPEIEGLGWLCRPEDAELVLPDD